MNEVINARIEEYGDIDWFSLDSLGPGQDGVLEIITQSDKPKLMDIFLTDKLSGAMEYISQQLGFISIHTLDYNQRRHLTFDLKK